MKKIYEKASQKLSALAKISKLTTPTQRKKLINSFINAQFTYCRFIGMFFSWKGCYKRINKIHEMTLRLILNDYESRITVNEKTIHHRCIINFTHQSVQIFKRLLVRLNEWSLLFTSKPLQLTQFKYFCHW